MKLNYFNWNPDSCKERTVNVKLQTFWYGDILIAFYITLRQFKIHTCPREIISRFELFYTNCIDYAKLMQQLRPGFFFMLSGNVFSDKTSDGSEVKQRERATLHQIFHILPVMRRPELYTIPQLRPNQGFVELQHELRALKLKPSANES